MHRSRKRERHEESNEPAIGSYHELYFTDVADAVTFCQNIVPHVVPPCGSLSEGQPSQMAVWLHVPRRSERSTHGCYLYLSQGVRESLERVGKPPHTTGTISRVALPATSVLVFGNDSLDQRADEKHGARPIGSRSSRIALFEAALDEADAVLR